MRAKFVSTLMIAGMLATCAQQQRAQPVPPVMAPVASVQIPPSPAIRIPMHRHRTPEELALQQKLEEMATSVYELHSKLKELEKEP